MDFRIHMVRAACQDDAVAVVLLKPGKGFLAFCLHIPSGLLQLLPGLVGRVNNFRPGHGAVGFGVGAEGI